MPITKNRRWRLFADARLQGEFLVRLTVYWIILLISIIGTIALFSFISNGEASATNMILPIVIVSGLVLPLVMFDAVAFSNRFAGPIVRLTREIREIANGKRDGQLVFRPGDFYTELEKAFNDAQLRGPPIETDELAPAHVETSDSDLVGVGHE